MNRLSLEKRVRILSSFSEGMGVRGIARHVGCSVNTVQKLLSEVGSACASLLEVNLKGLRCPTVQLDEIWSFVGARNCRLSNELRGSLQIGDVWIWVAMCQETRLVICTHAGNRGLNDARAFIKKLASRVNYVNTIYTDGHPPYVRAIREVFDNRVNHGRIVKTISARIKKRECVTGTVRTTAISTNYVERFNLTLRTRNRRFARKTNAHSKNLANHVSSLNIHNALYNFVHVHTTLKTTPAIAAGIADKVWTFEDLINQLDNEPADVVTCQPQKPRKRLKMVPDPKKPEPTPPDVADKDEDFAESAFRVFKKVAEKERETPEEEPPEDSKNS